MRKGDFCKTSGVRHLRANVRQVGTQQSANATPKLRMEERSDKWKLGQLQRLLRREDVDNLMRIRVRARGVGARAVPDGDR